jgi:hypothetical protein
MGDTEDMSESREASERPERRRRLGPVGQAAGLARIGAAAWWRTAIWTGAASARVGSRVMRAASQGQAPGDLFRSTRDDVRVYARRVLGIVDPDEIRRAASDLTAPRATSSSNGAPRSLQEMGADLLRRSADVNFEEEAHPAYARILEDLAPDEGRILRLLALEGPQPSVDIRSGLLPLNATSEMVAPGLNMIGAEAGCRHLDDVPAYLNNLFRLGLIWFSREPLDDPLRYQVLEAQPAVVGAIKEAGRARTVRRSVELTPFGKDFCDLCLPFETAEFEALGRDSRMGGSRRRTSADGGEPDAGEHGDV